VLTRTHHHVHSRRIITGTSTTTVASSCTPAALLPEGRCKRAVSGVCACHLPLFKLSVHVKQSYPSPSELVRRLPVPPLVPLALIECLVFPETERPRAILHRDMLLSWAETAGMPRGSRVAARGRLYFEVGMLQPEAASVT
jgi:hypothetical protein